MLTTIFMIIIFICILLFNKKKGKNQKYILGIILIFIVIFLIIKLLFDNKINNVNIKPGSQY